MQQTPIVDLQESDAHALFAKLKPGPGRPRQQVRRHQQARLRGAMVELAGSHGYEAVTVRGIVALAGVSTATFYKHLPNIEACLLSTYDVWMTRIFGRARAAQVACDREAELEASIASLLADFARNPKEARLAVIEDCCGGACLATRLTSFGRLGEAGRY